ncbi:hypothetical protein AOXY_G7488 [Acipenser oxyrinchus oxyrinchus]|uniref:Acyl-CoA oxidase C-terminal domain-containing protein n=1 Tax=Acipenser oxyrinchus oxyrinchus TaxID=40147 RepID=A0AAD8LMR9_ACIOX|nr:hypothetical protein AOXY_G7488 [Acipenser oxyrinchus oxyrinchus]
MVYLVFAVTLEKFSLAVEVCQVQENQTLLMKFCLLHGINLVYQERAGSLKHNYLTPATSTQIRRQWRDLYKSVKDEALQVVSECNIPHCCIQAPITRISNYNAEWAFCPLPQLPQTTDLKGKDIKIRCRL